ncbi:MAG: sensor histidine kinase, partial [Thermanaeromonas sp.]|uniref:sensor histidine kinase n=1 Tax=Thermanaeromonas sp. TaxID=2003697 RepID=UPI00243C78EC
AQEEERKRIARELHDQVGQSLTYLIISLQRLKETVGGVETEEKLEELRKLTGDILQILRELAFELRPSLLDNLGLKEAVERYCHDYAHKYQIKVDIQAYGEWKTIPSEIATTLYRVIQEALTNVARHARASQVSLILERRDCEVMAIIEDDGCGFIPEEVLSEAQGRKYLGLFGMQERVALVGGTFTIESSPGQGTTIYIKVPLGGRENGK